MAEPIHNSRKNDDIPDISAGTAVFDNDDNLLLVLQSNIWSLPKGSVKNGETIYDAACRETAEETKIVTDIFVPFDIRAIYLFDKIYWIFIYKINTYDIITKNLKNTNGIQDIKWFPKSEWLKMIHNKKYKFNGNKVNRLTIMFLQNMFLNNDNKNYKPDYKKLGYTNNTLYMLQQYKVYKNPERNSELFKHLRSNGGKRKTIRSKHYKRYQNKTKKRKLT